MDLGNLSRALLTRLLSTPNQWDTLKPSFEIANIALKYYLMQAVHREVYLRAEKEFNDAAEGYVILERINREYNKHSIWSREYWHAEKKD